MKPKDFFDNCHIFFQDDEDAQSVPITGIIERDKDGIIQEIMFINKQYEEFLVVNRKGETLWINAEEGAKKSSDAG